MSRHVGFTGTKRGMTERQLALLAQTLIQLSEQGFTVFHHGRCTGSDVQAAKAAKMLGYQTAGHPGLTSWDVPEWQDDQIFPAKPPLERNVDIVTLSERLIATPGQGRELVRSGTWHTVRQARKAFKQIYLHFP